MPEPTADRRAEPAGRPQRAGSRTDGRARLLRPRCAARPSRGQLVAGAAARGARLRRGHPGAAPTSKDDNFVGARQGDLIQFINNLSLASQRAENEIAQLAADPRRPCATTPRPAVPPSSWPGGRPTRSASSPAPCPRSARASGSRSPTAAPASAPTSCSTGSQELRDAGAEAIEINDTVRVVAQTSLQDDRERRSPRRRHRCSSRPTSSRRSATRTTWPVALDFTGGFVSDVRVASAARSTVERARQGRHHQRARSRAAPEYAEPGPTG